MSRRESDGDAQERTARDNDLGGRDDTAYEDDTAYDDTGYGDDTTYDDSDDSDDSYVEEGAAALLLVVGIILFFFPEPFTSLIGIGLIILGVLTWLADYFLG